MFEELRMRSFMVAAQENKTSDSFEDLLGTIKLRIAVIRSFTMSTHVAVWSYLLPAEINDFLHTSPVILVHVPYTR